MKLVNTDTLNHVQGENTMFSIIVPCYNLEHWIDACLASVQKQAYADWECIVVDDGSQDNSPAIINAFAAGDSRFRVIHQKNAGEGEARNAGLEIACGEWLLFLDGDDVMAPGTLERLARIIDESPEENLIRFRFQSFEDGETIPQPEMSCHINSCVIDISKKITYDDYYVYVWQFLYRRTLTMDMRFKRYMLGADRTFIVPILCSKVDSFVSVDDVCYFYRHRKGSISHLPRNVQMLKDELSHRLDVIETMDKSGKEISYCHSYWLEHYCLREYLRLVEYSGDYSPDEQSQLVEWFYCELPRICQAKGYSFAGKAKAQLYRVSSQKKWRYWLVIVVPKVEEYLRIFVNPQRVFRCIKRRLHGILH